MRDGTASPAGAEPSPAGAEPSPAGAEPSPAGAEWIADQSRWAHGWRRVVFPGIFLAYLVEVATAIPSDARGLGLVAGFVILAAFGIGYVAVVPSSWGCDGRRHVIQLAVLTALFAAELPFAHADALVMGVFIAAAAIVKYGERAFALTVGMTVLAVVLPGIVPSWHDTFSTGLANGTAIAIPMVSLGMFAFGRIVRGNRQLVEARSEIARLASENERSRIARDLHDLLGHSLTTITVKAELAQRLSQRDVEGAAREIAEVEALSRRALSDVRAAVANYREVTLAGELATGREVLRAAGIVAELPPAVDVVDDATQELFGWVVREGVTNVVRHSRAASCAVRISASSVEIVDDGIGGSAPGPDGGAASVVGRASEGRTASGPATRPGYGLAGLAERVGAAGGIVEAGPVAPSGWRLAVRLLGAAP